jgi:outer membrane protein TolC
MNRNVVVAASVAALLLTGCMVGPKYVKPTVPLAPEYKEAGPNAAAYKESSDWRSAQPADTAQRGEWWTIFGDAELNTLEPRIAAENQNLKAAEARFREARALIRYNRASLAPIVGAAPFAGGVRDSANRPYFNAANTNNGAADIQLPLDLNYEIDLWGRIRRSVNASRDEAQASAGDLQTALLSLQAELAVDYFEARSADAQEKLLNDTVKEYEEAYRITNNRFEGGVAPQSDVDQARTQLEAARVQANDVTRRADRPTACILHVANSGAQCTASGYSAWTSFRAAGAPTRHCYGGTARCRSERPHRYRACSFLPHTVAQRSWRF